MENESKIVRSIPDIREVNGHKRTKYVFTPGQSVLVNRDMVLKYRREKLKQLVRSDLKQSLFTIVSLPDTEIFEETESGRIRVNPIWQEEDVNATTIDFKTDIINQSRRIIAGDYTLDIQEKQIATGNIMVVKLITALPVLGIGKIEGDVSVNRLMSGLVLLNPPDVSQNEEVAS